MIIGDVSKFAVEFEVATEPHGDWLLGGCCYWIYGQEVGDPRLLVSLRDFLHTLEELSRFAGFHYDSTLSALEKDQLGDLLTRGLFGRGGPDPSIQRQAIDEQWLRFVAIPEVASFDNWFIFLVSTGACDRCLVRRLDQQGFGEFQLSVGLFDCTIANAIRELSAKSVL